MKSIQSDHNPVSCTTLNGFRKPDENVNECMFKPLKKNHKFPWSNLEFQEFYINQVDILCKILLTTCKNWSTIDLAKNLTKEIRKILLRSARSADLNVE